MSSLVTSPPLPLVAHAAGAEPSGPLRVVPPQLCAVVTTYRSPRSLRLSLLALEREAERTGAVLELIVADDGDLEHQSRGPALEAARSGRFQRVRRLWQSHHGYGKVRLANKAITRAEAPLLLYLDGDMLLAPGKHEHIAVYQVRHRLHKLRRRGVGIIIPNCGPKRAQKRP